MNDTIAADYLPLLQGGRWFRAISPALQQALLAAAAVRRLAAGERLFSRGDAADGLYCVVAGAIRASGSAASGKEALLTYLEPPDWFGEIALIDGGCRTHDAWAGDASTLLHVPAAALDALLRAHPDYWRDIAALVADKLRLAFIALEDLALMPGPQRLARRLLMIAEGYGNHAGDSPRRLRIAQEDLAAMVSLSRQTTNQILKDLEALGALRLHRGGIDLLDAGLLRQRADSPP